MNFQILQTGNCNQMEIGLEIAIAGDKRKCHSGMALQLRSIIIITRISPTVTPYLKNIFLFLGKKEKNLFGRKTYSAAAKFEAVKKAQVISGEAGQGLKASGADVFAGFRCGNNGWAVNATRTHRGGSRPGSHYQPQGYPFQFTPSGEPICAKCNRVGHKQKDCHSSSSTFSQPSYDDGGYGYDVGYEGGYEDYDSQGYDGAYDDYYGQGGYGGPSPGGGGRN